MKRNNGFTLIELIAVIAILAILAATAIPQFVDLRTDARRAAASGVAGALSSSASLAYAKRVASGTASAVSACTDLVSPTFVSGVTVTATAAPGDTNFGVQGGALTNGVAGTCTLHHGDQSVTFTAIGNS